MKLLHKSYLILMVLLASSILLKAQFIVNSNGIPITNSTVLATNGIWQNTGSVTNNGTIITSEKWTNSGTLSGIGGFILNYSVNNDFVAGSNSATIGFLEKNGSGVTNLSGKVYVRDSLKISNGIIHVNTGADTLGLLAVTLVSVAPGSYVEGAMAHKGSGTFSLPTGLSGNYLPITFHNSTSTWVGAVVEPAPGGYDVGDAVNSLFGFPYVWKTTKANAADTARFIEVKVPDVLLGFDNIIVTRQSQGINQYEAMGTKVSTSAAGFTSYKSYDRGLKGTFSLGVGYPRTPQEDSLQLVALFDATNGPSWTTRTNWKAAGKEVVEWFGVKQKGGLVTEITLPNNRLEGAVPETFVDLPALKTLDLSDNWQQDISGGITSIPDFTGMTSLQTVNVSGNALDFEDLEQNASLISVDIGRYENQAPLQSIPYQEITAGTTNYPVTLPEPVGGTPANTSYQWQFWPYFGGTGYQDIVGATNEVYQIPVLDRSNIGRYKVKVANSAVPGLLLESEDFVVEAIANISGVLSFGGNTVQRTSDPTFKEMQLLQVTSDAYDTIKFFANGERDPNPLSTAKGVNVSADGSGFYEFKKVLLRDYIINGFPDTARAQYNKAVPTWYKEDGIGSIFWEEASIIELNADKTDGNFSATVRPDEFTNIGTLSGYFEETLPDDGRIEKKSRVKDAPVIVRKVDESGRGTEETLELFAYAYTDDNGEFIIDRKLPDGEYRLNLQYPGYPMDETSFITIPIVNNLFEKQVRVFADVIANKVFVRKLVITGWEEETPGMSAYPNPTVEYVFIHGLQEQAVSLTVVDMEGRSTPAQAQWNTMERRWEVDVRTLQKGVYVVKINSNGKIKNLKVIVQ